MKFDVLASPTPDDFRVTKILFTLVRRDRIYKIKDTRDNFSWEIPNIWHFPGISVFHHTTCVV